jgi:hypothetical protein
VGGGISDCGSRDAVEGAPHGISEEPITSLAPA